MAAWELESSLKQAFVLSLLLSAVPLLTSMAVGFVISVLQAATQIQEQTLSFVPKMAAVVGVLYFAGPWLAGQLVDYLSSLLLHLDTVAAGW